MLFNPLKVVFPKFPQGFLIFTPKFTPNLDLKNFKNKHVKNSKINKSIQDLKRKNQNYSLVIIKSNANAVNSSPKNIKRITEFTSDSGTLNMK